VLRRRRICPERYPVNCSVFGLNRRTGQRANRAIVAVNLRRLRTNVNLFGILKQTMEIKQIYLSGKGRVKFEQAIAQHFRQPSEQPGFIGRVFVKDLEKAFPIKFE